MKVTAGNNGAHHSSGAGYGVKLAASDRDRHLFRSWKSVFVRLPNGKEIEVNTDKPSFWSGSCRELISREIGQWMIGSGLAPWRRGLPPKLILSEESPRHFRIRIRR